MGVHRTVHEILFFFYLGLRRFPTQVIALKGTVRRFLMGGSQDRFLRMKSIFFFI